jgi:hypothetical protein
LGDAFCSAPARELVPPLGNRPAGGDVWDFWDVTVALPESIQAYNYTPNDPRINVTGGLRSIRAAPTKLATFAGTDDLCIVHGNHQLAIGGIRILV